MTLIDEDLGSSQLHIGLTARGNGQEDDTHQSGKGGKEGDAERVEKRVGDWVRMCPDHFVSKMEHGLLTSSSEIVTLCSDTS